MKQILIFILCLNTSVWAQEEFHATRDLGSSYTPSSTSIMTERIKEAAKQYKSHKPIPRYAQFDYAFA